MPEPATASTRKLEATAWRYAARELPPPESAEFEARLADDQSARDALSEAVRLSAAALGQPAPTPHPSFRSRIFNRLRARRRVSRRHPFTWMGLGALASVALFLTVSHFGVGRASTMRDGSNSALPAEQSLPVQTPARKPRPEFLLSAELAAPVPGVEPPRTEAEIWAELSTPEHVEKVHDDEARLLNHLKGLQAGHTRPPARMSPSPHAQQ